MNITLKDGSVKVYDAPMTAADITKDISMGLYRAACCCRIDGQVRDFTMQRRAVVISESKDGGYGLLLDPRRTTVTQIAGGDGGALTLHVETKEVSWHLPRRGEGHITLAYTLLLGTQALSALRLELTLTKEERDV